MDTDGAHLAQHQLRLRAHQIRKVAQSRDEQHRDRARRRAHERAHEQRPAVEEARRLDRVVTSQVAFVRLLRYRHARRAHAHAHRWLAHAIEENPRELRAPLRLPAAVCNDGDEAYVPVAMGQREHEQCLHVVWVGPWVCDDHDLGGRRRAHAGTQRRGPHYPILIPATVHTD